MNRETYIKRLEANIASLKDRAASFAAKVVDDYAYALEWSDDEFNHAATLKVLLEVHAYFTAPEAVTRVQVIEHLRSEIMRRAQYPRFSTSQPSNLMHSTTTAAYAKVCEDLSYCDFE